jgi:predicted transcriptional regulator
MGVGEVIGILENAQEPLTSKQIADVLGVNWSTARANLKRLITQNKVEVRRNLLKRGGMTYLYMLRK